MSCFSIGERHYVIDGNACLVMEVDRAMRERLAGERAARERLVGTPDPCPHAVSPPPAPTTDLCLMIAQRCNLACRYCFADPCLIRERGAGAGMMRRATARRAVDFLIDASAGAEALNVTFFGGEPLLNLDVMADTIVYCRSLEAATGKRFHFHLTTNGTLLTPRILDLLAREQVSVIVSVDGPPPVHDDLRPFRGGRGSYERVIANARALAAAYPCDGITVGDFTVRSTFTAAHLDLAGTFEHLVALGFRQISIEPAVVDRSSGLALTSDHLPRLEEEYLKLARSWLRLERAGRHVVLFAFRKLVECVRQPKLHLRHCGAGNEYMAVAADGTLYPCHKLVGEPALRLGNVREGVTAPAVAARLHGLHLNAKRSCGGCWARFYCGGGCHAHGYFANGDLAVPHRMDCELLERRLEIAAWLASELGEERLAGGAAADERGTATRRTA